MELTEERVKAIVKEATEAAVQEALLSLGLDAGNKIQTQRHMAAMSEVAELIGDLEYQADLLHLRRWRKSMEQASSLSMKTALTITITGFISIVVLGFRAWLDKQ